MSDARLSRAIDVLEHGGAGRLADSLARQRWFGSKNRSIAAVRLTDAARLSESSAVILAIVHVDFTDGPGESYFLPLMMEPSETTAGTEPSAAVRISEGTEAVAVSDATYDSAACLALVQGIGQGRQWEGRGGVFAVQVTQAGRAALSEVPCRPKRIAAEQSNTSIVYDRRLILKIIRKLEPGTNPDREILEFLTTRTQYRHVPLLLGALEYARQADPLQESTVAVLQSFIENQGDGWAYTIDHLRSLLSEARRGPEQAGDGNARELVRRFSEEYHRSIRRLGEITGDLHVALQTDRSDPAFRPEPTSGHDVEAWKNAMVSQLDAIMTQCRTLSEPACLAIGLTRQELCALLENARLRIEGLPTTSAEGLLKIRVHGDYHLGQVLKTPDGFAILDFEGSRRGRFVNGVPSSARSKMWQGDMRSFSYAAEMLTREPGGNTDRTHVGAGLGRDDRRSSFGTAIGRSRGLLKPALCRTIPNASTACFGSLRWTRPYTSYDTN